MDKMNLKLLLGVMAVGAGGTVLLTASNSPKNAAPAITADVPAAAFAPQRIETPVQEAALVVTPAPAPRAAFIPSPAPAERPVVRDAAPAPVYSQPVYTQPVHTQPVYTQVALNSSPDRPSPTEQQLDALLAPIALYPDQLLSQILMAATYPLDVIEAARWSERPENQGLQGDRLSYALEDMDWDPSVKALVAFPDILKMLNRDIDWMAKLGDAFALEEGHVMDAVQRLRREARDADRLNSDARQRVTFDDDQIIIEPANPEVIYVLFYDPRVAYGLWPYPDYPPFYIPPPLGYTYQPGIYYSYVSIRPFWGWSRWDWGRRRIDIVDLQRYTYYNRGRAPGGDRGVWRHEPDHRRGVQYGGKFRGEFNNRPRPEEQVRLPRPDSGGARGGNRDNNRDATRDNNRDATRDATRDDRRDNSQENFRGGPRENDNFRTRRPQNELPNVAPPLPATAALPNINATPQRAPEAQGREQFDDFRARRQRQPEVDQQPGQQEQRNRGDARGDGGGRPRQFQQDSSIGAPPVSNAPQTDRPFRGGSIQDRPLTNIQPVPQPQAVPQPQIPQPQAQQQFRENFRARDNGQDRGQPQNFRAPRPAPEPAAVAPPAAAPDPAAQAQPQPQQDQPENFRRRRRDQ